MCEGPSYVHGLGDDAPQDSISRYQVRRHHVRYRAIALEFALPVMRPLPDPAAVVDLTPQLTPTPHRPRIGIYRKGPESLWLPSGDEQTLAIPHHRRFSGS